MSVWVCTPSARPVEEVEPWARRLRGLGYKIALWRDRGEIIPGVGLVRMGHYPGYASSVNELVREVLTVGAEWIVALADDTDPDLAHTADEIAAQCSEHFRGTFGVMQPTGDRFAGGQIDRICGSPWIGREFARRINQGRGPFWPEYPHMFPDEELQNVAIKYGVLWQRPDLIHLHRHFQRESGAIGSNAVARPEPPPHMRPERNDGYTPEHWKKYEALFKTRRAQGFPGSEPIA